MTQAKQIRIWLLIWLAALAVWASSGHADVSLRFKDDVELLSRTFTLTDIATFEKAAPRFERKLAGVRIGRTPRPGLSRQITRYEVNAALERFRPGISRELQWRGPACLSIRGAGVQCDVSRMQQAARGFLYGRLSEKYDQVSVDPVDEPDPLMVPAGRVSFDSRIPSARRLAKRMPVWVDVQVDGQHFQTIPAWFAVTVHESVWIVQKDKAAKDRLARKDVVRCVKDIAGLSDPPLPAASLGTLRCVRQLPAGAIVTMADVEPVPAVCRGDVITVFANHGSVQIQIKAVAMADGRVSEQIAVQNPGSGESFRAMVIGNRQAKVN